MTIETTLPSESSLFLAMSRGDEQAFTTIFHRYTEKLYPIILSLTGTEADAREVIQEVFIRCWLNRDQLAHMTNPGGWLYTLAVNHTYNFLKAKGIYEEKLKRADVRADGDHSMELELDAKYTKELIVQAMQALPERRRRVFELARLEGYSRKEIARELSISENTVRNQLAEAIAFIQDYLQRHSSIYLPAILIGLHDWTK